MCVVGSSVCCVDVDVHRIRPVDQGGALEAG